MMPKTKQLLLDAMERQLEELGDLMTLYHDDCTLTLRKLKQQLEGLKKLNSPAREQSSRKP